jgi:hypothetical protein
MDVIGAGFGRTGTMSLKAALEHLGFGPCMHMICVMEDPSLASHYVRALKGDREALVEALRGFRSTVDWPTTFFWRELIGEFPKAKVILTERDPAMWFESASSTIFSAGRRARDAGGAREMPPDLREMVNGTVIQGEFGGRIDDREHAIRVFEEHNAAVRAEVPADRLLVFEVARGWEPLCDFLGVPVPEEPFPRTNDRAAFEARAAARRG